MRRYLDDEIWRLYTRILRLEERVNQLMRIARLNGVVLFYDWDNNTDTSLEPAAGTVKGNNAQISSVTEFAYSTTDAYDREIIGETVLEPGDLITVSAADLSSASVFTVDALPALQGSPPTWARMSVTLVQSGGGWNPAGGDYLRISWRPDRIVV